MVWTWSVQAALGSKIPIEVWDNITGFADPREQSLSMPTAPRSHRKLVGFLSRGSVYPNKSFHYSKHVFVDIVTSHARRNGNPSLHACPIRGLRWK